MAMRKLLLTILSVFSLVTISDAETAAEVTKSINKVKRDTLYIYAESTNKDLKEAYNNARTILEMQVGEWVRKQHPSENIEVCIVKAKENFMQLDTRRGELYRAFVYVKKSDIMAVSDKSEVKVIEIAPTTQSNQVKAEPAIIISEESVAKIDTPVIELTSEEQQMKQVRSFYDVEPYIKGLKSNNRLRAYGKYATMPSNEDCHLFVYDKQGNISAMLRKSGTTQFNLNTLKEDNVMNYKNCGAIWFQLK
jgi:hypothetical protein